MLLNHERHQDSWPPEKNSIRGQRWGMIAQSFCVTSVQFSLSVVSDTSRPHESYHTRPPCPSPTPRVHSDSCPSSQWCHPAISSSVVPFSSCPQSLPASESFPMNQLFSWGGQSIGAFLRGGIRSVLGVHWKHWCWSWNSNTLATWCEELTHLKRPWWFRAGGEGDDRGWDGWMASQTRRTWVWVNSGIGDGQGGLACCGPWGLKESDTTEWLNWLILLIE